MCLCNQYVSDGRKVATDAHWDILAILTIDCRRSFVHRPTYLQALRHSMRHTHSVHNMQREHGAVHQRVDCLENWRRTFRVVMTITHEPPQWRQHLQQRFAFSNVYLDSSPIELQQADDLYDCAQMPTNAGKSGTLSGEFWRGRLDGVSGTLGFPLER